MLHTKMNRRMVMKTTAVAGASALVISENFLAAQETDPPFGTEFANLELLTTGEWWKRPGNNGTPPAEDHASAPPNLHVPRDEVVAFAMYTHHAGVLKLSAQLFPLKPGEKREARLEFKRGGKWSEVAKSEVHYPGWDTHFRMEKWDNRKDVPYRVLHGEKARFEGLIRRDPSDKEEIVIANLSCNSSRTNGPREEIVNNLRRHDPDLLYFGGDQHQGSNSHRLNRA